MSVCSGKCKDTPLPDVVGSDGFVDSMIPAWYVARDGLSKNMAGDGLLVALYQCVTMIHNDEEWDVTLLPHRKVELLMRDCPECVSWRMPCVAGICWNGQCVL